MVFPHHANQPIHIVENKKKFESSTEYILLTISSPADCLQLQKKISGNTVTNFKMLCYDCECTFSCTQN